MLGRDPFCGHLFVFRGRRSDLIKIVWHDGQGGCLFMKRLDRGRFTWPSASDGAVPITPAQLAYLTEGIGLEEPAADVAADPGRIAERLATADGCDLIGV